MISRSDKALEIEELTQKFASAKAAFLVDFKGMSVEQVTLLRKRLHGASSEFRVVRNTLAIRALQGVPKSELALKSSLVGNNAVVFAYGEAAASAKALSEYAKDVEQLQLKVGVFEGQALSVADVKALAALPSKEVLRSQLLGMLSAPASTFVRLLNAVPSGFVRVLDAKAQK